MKHSLYGNSTFELIGISLSLVIFFMMVVVHQGDYKIIVKLHGKKKKTSETQRSHLNYDRPTRGVSSIT